MSHSQQTNNASKPSNLLLTAICAQENFPICKKILAVSLEICNGPSIISYELYLPFYSNLHIKSKIFSPIITMQHIIMQPTTYLKVIHNTAQINQTDPHN